MSLLWNNSESMHSTIVFQIIVNFCQLAHCIVTSTFADGHVIEFVVGMLLHNQAKLSFYRIVCHLSIENTTVYLPLGEMNVL